MSDAVPPAPTGFGYADHDHVQRIVDRLNAEEQNGWSYAVAGGPVYFFIEARDETGAVTLPGETAR